MDCMACGSAAVTERPERTTRGYRRFRCQDGTVKLSRERHRQRNLDLLRSLINGPELRLSAMHQKHNC